MGYQARDKKLREGSRKLSQSLGKAQSPSPPSWLVLAGPSLDPSWPFRVLSGHLDSSRPLLLPQSARFRGRGLLNAAPPTSVTSRDLGRQATASLSTGRPIPPLWLLTFDPRGMWPRSPDKMKYYFLLTYD